jgi:carbon storage regulator
MLVITRRVGEAIWIGKDIKVIVTSLQGGAVKLGIEAPQEIQILRDELTIESKGDKEDGHKRNDE